MTGKFAVGTATPGNKVLTVAGVIDFMGAGAGHNFFTQGPGNNMQIRANVDEANTVYDPSRSQWNMVLGSASDMFSIKRSPAGGAYNEDALFFINGSNGRIGVGVFDTGNTSNIPFTPSGQFHVYTSSGDANRGETADSSSASAVVVGSNSSSTGHTVGVWGQASSDTGTGVVGLTWSTSGSTYGVFGQSDSTQGSGVYGNATATSGFTEGAYGVSSSPNGTGVQGSASSTTGANYGVFGVSSSTSGYGVYGVATATTGTTYGIYGATNSSTGYAGWFSGDVHITGTLSKSGGSFKIDHPLDPAHMYLQHSFVESPDMMNIYNDNVTLDAKGEAWVELPAWFEALNMDFRYQLTPIGAAMPNLNIAQKIKDNTFQIGGGIPGMEVSWMVTSIRHDPYAEANRVQVEVPKLDHEQGTYLFPGLYDQHEDLRLGALFGNSLAQRDIEIVSVEPKNDS